MSSGGVFQLIANEGKADRIIMATPLLNQRIRDIICAREAEGRKDVTPTLSDIERTHILFINAHFKPYAAIGFEYNRVRNQSGVASLNSGVVFSIPQFGDFFHDMVCHTRFEAVTESALTAPAQGTAGYPAANTYTDGSSAAQGTLVSYSLVAWDGTAVSDRGSYYNLLRYCEYPANRLPKTVKFDVNGNPLDEYDETVTMMIQKFLVPYNKYIGYNRLVGQENPIYGYGELRNSIVTEQSTYNWTTSAGAITHETGDTVYGGPAADDYATIVASGFLPSNDVNRELRAFVDGPQTPKVTQPILDLWMKLYFWFNEDPRLSIASVSIPFGMRFISIDLCQKTDLLFEFPGLYVQQIISIADGNNVVQYFPYLVGMSTNNIPDLTISNMDLYVNNIFVNPEVHDIFIQRIGFTLIRVYRRQKQRINQSGTDEKQLTQFKWPVEYLFVGIRPTWNINTNNREMWRDWHRLCRVTPVEVNDPDLAMFDTTAGGGVSIYDSITRSNYGLPLQTVDNISITAQAIKLYDDLESEFFNSYTTVHYGGFAINTPDDIGAHFIPFALFPRSYQPSGHINISRAREFYVKWTSSYVDANCPAELIAVGVAINFLLITDGSAVLRYST